MLLSISLMLFMGILFSALCKKIKVPSLIGMLFVGMILGPNVLNLMDAKLLNISAELREIALIIILCRAGLNLNLEDLKKIGRPAVLMCFLPAILEILGMILLAPPLLGLSIADAALLGTVVAATSPAVIVPSMLKVMEEGYGQGKRIPQMILASASVDDVFVIVLFTVFLSLGQGGTLVVSDMLGIPITIFLGAIVGAIIGILWNLVFQRVHMRDSQKVILLLSTGFFLVSLEDLLTKVLPFSGLIAIMVMGMVLKTKYNQVAVRLANKFSKVWIFAEILLFVLVGASLDMAYAFQAGGIVILLILFVLVFRLLGVFLCLIGSKLNRKERLFTVIGYMPKATVQAAIGGVPLAMGFASGNLILTVSVIAILVTAPLGAFLIERTYKILLEREEER